MASAFVTVTSRSTVTKSVTVFGAAELEAPCSTARIATVWTWPNDVSEIAAVFV
jgi:hypothetical protein